jgi:hypothetical protein
MIMSAWRMARGGDQYTALDDHVRVADGARRALGVALQGGF